MKNHEILETLGKSIKTQTLYNPNYTQGGPFTHSVIFSNDPYPTTIFGNELCFLVEIAFKSFESKVVFSVGSKDQIASIKEETDKIEFKNKSLPVFMRPSFPHQLVLKEVLVKLGSLTELFNHLDQDQLISLYVYKNGVQLFVHAHNPEQLTKSVSSLHMLVSQLPRESTEIADLTKLPIKFHPLIPLITELGIEDDEGRSKKIATLPEGRKKEIYILMEPYFTQINEYLNSYIEPLPDECLKLQRTVEAVSEIKMLINQ